MLRVFPLYSHSAVYLDLTRFVDRFIEASKAQSPNYMETMSGREPSFYPKIVKLRVQSEAKMAKRNH